MTKHTEGPWVVVEHEVWDTRSDGEPGIPLFRRDSNYRRWGRDLRAGEAEANARLIAAAPELLAALIEAREALHFHYTEWDGEPEDAVPLQLARSKCDAALAKARGDV